MANIAAVLSNWIDKEITVVNPQSFSETVIRDVVQLETYQANINEIGDDYVRLSFDAPKKRSVEHVDQLIPLREIKRVSQWGDERILHL
jgi:hypothetical protein